MEYNQVIETAFSDDQLLKKRIFDAIDETPQHALLFGDIARHAQYLRNGPSLSGSADNQPASKKRKLENGLPSGPGSIGHPEKKVIYEVKDISFSIPQRKKLHLEIAIDGQSGKDEQARMLYTIQTRNPASKEIEYETGLNTLKQVLCLPAPEKAQKQYNYCVMPTNGLGDASNGHGAVDGVNGEPLLWTINDGPLKSSQVLDPQLQKLMDEAGNHTLEVALYYAIQRGSLHDDAGKIVHPSEAEFVSAVPEAHRKGEKAYHVKAFRGSKDGYLFFLSTGIFFGFKKPLQFFDFDQILSISYTSVLQRTFNLNIIYRIPGNPPKEGEQEFSMLDQADFACIDAYIKRHELQDASMAEARKAKLANVNGHGKKGAVIENAEEPGELQKAQQEIEDEEDEEEEDYDPGSEGQSDGSGTSSENEDEHADGGGDEGNLVQDELGSEAEDVEPDPDDEYQL